MSENLSQTTSLDKNMKTKSCIFAVVITITFLLNGIFAQRDIPNFYDFVELKIGDSAQRDIPKDSKRPLKFNFQTVCPTQTDFAAQSVFREYGAIFAADEQVVAPPSCILENEDAVQNFQSKANPQTENIAGISTTLQTPAMNALIAARREAIGKGLAITPRGTLGSKRSYRQTLSLWNSRFFPALAYWTRRGKISSDEADQAKTMNISRQVEQVLRWEQKGYYFGKSFDKSILFSVAVPGASQHIFMTALDVQQFSDFRVREILAKHGWYQTVKSDFPHFTYLGVEENKLPSMGLKKVFVGNYKFWLTNLETE